MAGMFRALRVRNYRLFLIGVLVSNTGTWVQRVAQTWLVLNLSGGDGKALGITTGLQFLPILLFGMWGGLIADRYSRRKLLMITQTSMALESFALAALDFSGVAQLWHVYLFAFLLGTLSAVDNPARQSFVEEMVGRDSLSNAVALNSATFNVTRMIGPAIGGFLVAATGTSFSFLLNGLSFAALVGTYWSMRTSELHSRRLVKRRSGQLRETWTYLRRRSDLLLVMVLIGAVNTFGQNFQITIALMTDSVYLGGPQQYGWMFSALSLGSVTGALLAARRAAPRIRYIAGGALALAVLEILAALAPTNWLFAVLLVPLGVVSLTVVASSNAMVQLGVPQAIRGRIMAVYLLVSSGGRPLGGPLIGWIADEFGARWGFAFGGIAVGVCTVAVLIAWRRRTHPGPAVGTDE